MIIVSSKSTVKTSIVEFVFKETGKRVQAKPPGKIFV